MRKKMFNRSFIKLNSHYYLPSYFYYLNKKVLLKSLTLIVLCILMITGSFSWMYHEYKSNGASIKVGSIKHEVREYDQNGTLVNDNDETMSIIYETNMSSLTKNTRYIEVKNTGSLDMEYSLTFTVDGDIGETGILYYRLYDITEKVKSSSPTGVYDTKLKAYAHNNPIPDDIESNTSNPVYNLTTMNDKIVIGQIEKDNDNDENNSVYYRLDYGIYSNIDSSIYSDSLIALHMNVYSSQLGTITSELELGKIWDVQNEEQFRAALQGAYPGDTIRLLEDIVIDGTIEINKRVSIDTNEQLFKVTGDLVYDFISLGKLTIDVTGSGRIEVGNDFYLNAPKAQVEIVGANKASDMVVNNKMTVNGIQDGEKDGILLDNVKIVKNTTNYIPIDITVLSNTRLTIAPDVQVGFITANTGSTNIEIINNGIISQIQLQNMSLLDSFTKPQIYIYNLGDIYGTVGSTSIILPATATPYKGSGNGNTLIVKGVTSSDITVSGSDSFKDNEIEDITEGTSVIPYEDEENAYYVYIREPSDTLEGLLTEYFEQKNEVVTTKLAAINKLTIYTLNAQYVENDDFDFIKSDQLLSITHLDLSSARVKDNSTVNRIKSGALQGKNTLTYVALPKTATEIGSYAFSGINLGALSSDPAVNFTFLTIPANVDVIESNAFTDSKYIRFEGTNPPTKISPDAFNTADDGAKMFVLDGVESTYQAISSLNSSNIFRYANVSDNRRYFVYEVGEDLGISYIVNNSLSTTTLGIPDQITYLSASKKVVEIGTNAYRHIAINSTEGVAASLPSTIHKIGSYAFYQLNITNIDLTNVTFIGKYAFYQTSLERIVAPSVEEIEEYAFYNNKATILSLSSIKTIGDYAFALSENLYEINLSNVSYIGKYAFYDCKHISRVYFSNANSGIVNNKEEINLYVGENALFSNWGYYVNDRLRVYVPSGSSSEGNSYVQLYKDKFSNYERYIYERGINIGSYYHMEVPYDLTEYTVKEKTITTPNGNVAVGLEIISYQGSDLTSEYSLPTELTVNDQVMDVISIGDNAYRNTQVATGEEITIFTDNLVNIGSYAFQNLKIKSITASKVETIGAYAFSGSSLNKGIFRSIVKLGDYALANLEELYVLDLGTIREFGFNCIANDRNLEQLFISNKEINITINGTPFSNIGTNTNGRLRIYVPDIDLVLDYYKKLLPDYVTYIYPTGRIEGSYVNSPIDYDIGEYSLRETTITDKNGIVHTGYEIIEYHGADLTPAYNIPEVIYPITTDVKVTWTKGDNCWNNGLTCTYTATIKNNSDNEITSWEFDLALPEGTVIAGGWGGEYTVYDGYATVKNAGYNGTIPINGSIDSLNLQITFPNLYLEPEVTAVRIDMGSNSGLSIISVGDYAYYHVNAMSGYKYSIDNNSILTIGEYAFKGNKSLENFNSDSVEQIKKSAFEDSGLVKGTFQNLNKIESNAFSNLTNLYHLNLGTVMNMEEKAVANCNYLYQLFFTGTKLNFNYHSDSLYNIGSLTNNRLRIYVSEGTDSSSKTYAESYSMVFNKNYQNSFYTQGTLIGSYVPNDINNDIEEMSIKKVKLRNQNNVEVIGWEIIEYHGKELSASNQLPNTIAVGEETYPIVSIGSKAFINNQVEASATIEMPSGILEIKDYAFYQTSIGKLESTSLIKVGEYAFSECSSLEEVILNNVVEIDSHAFYNNNALKNVTLSSIVEEIKDYAFYNTSSHNSLVNFYITTPNVPTIYEHTLPEYTTTVENNDPTIYVPYSAIANYQNADYWKNYPIQNIGNIYNQTFVYEVLENNELRITGYLQETTDLVIPDTITISDIEYKVTEIDGTLLDSITKVKSLTLPLYLKSVGDKFLAKNTSVQTITISADNEFFQTSDGILYDKGMTTLIKYPNGKVETSFTVPEGVIQIKSNAFSNTINLYSITFNSDLFIISNGSFENCINLSTIKFTSTTPPYLTAFEILPINKNTTISIPTGSLSNYLNNPHYYKYRKYLTEE